MLGVVSNCYFVQYKFIIPNSMKHSNYTYQKLFRALYGYTQKVCKANGRTYSYHRRGVLSQVPYIKYSKNCVIIPQNSFPELKNFFQTGKNPAHKWVTKGDWKAVYYLNEKNVSEEEIQTALEQLLDRQYILSTSKEHEKLENELKNLLEKTAASQQIEDAYKKIALDEAQKILSLPWFKQVYSKSQKLASFNESFSKLRDAKP